MDPTGSRPSRDERQRGVSQGRGGLGIIHGLETESDQLDLPRQNLERLKTYCQIFPHRYRRAVEGVRLLPSTEPKSALLGTPDAVIPINVAIMPVTRNLPPEIWLNIWAHLKESRVLTIEDTFEGTLRLVPEIRPVPGGLLMSPVARNETLRTHKITFGDLLERPILFNRETDIVHFASEVTIDMMLKRPKAIVKTQDQNVRFAAISAGDYSLSIGTKNYAQMQSNRQLKRIAEVIRYFGTLEKVIIITDPLLSTRQSWEERRKWQAAWKATIEARVGRQYRDASFWWRAGEAKGNVYKFKWNMPEIVIVDTEDDLLPVSRGENTTALDRISEISSSFSIEGESACPKTCSKCLAK